jgi:hypothetical protein
MADNDDKEKRIREINRRLMQIKIQMDRLRQAAFLDPKSTGKDRFQVQQAKKDLDRLTEENDVLREELGKLTGKKAKD